LIKENAFKGELEESPIYYSIFDRLITLSNSGEFQIVGYHGTFKYNIFVGTIEKNTVLPFGEKDAQCFISGIKGKHSSSSKEEPLLKIVWFLCNSSRL